MSDNIEVIAEVEDQEEFFATGIDCDVLFHVTWFKVTERISSSYSLQVRGYSHADHIDLKKLIGRRIRLTEQRNLGGSAEGLRRRYFHGIIASVRQRNYVPELSLYEYLLDCRPALEALSMSSNCRVFGADEPRTLPEIVNFLLTDNFSGGASKTLDPVKAKISFKTDYLQADHDYKKRAFLVQYNETDLDFLQRQLERYGVFYFFDPSSEAETLVISDYNGSFLYTGSGDDPEGTTPLHWVLPTKYASGNTFKVKNFSPQYAWRSKELSLYDYKYIKASTELKYDIPLDEAGEGTISRFGGNLLPYQDDEGPLLSERTAELHLSDQESFSGESDCFQLAAGFMFPLLDYYNIHYNSDPGGKDMRAYLVTEVTHECSVPLPGEAWESGKHGHSADFTAIRAETAYRPAKATAVPQVPGPMPAVVDSAGDGVRADLDDKGRYLVHARFDVGGSPDGKHSDRMRAGQSYAGTTEGIAFPLRKGTDVMLGFVAGDIDRPMIQHAMPNPQHPSPIRSSNHTRARLVSASAITFEMEDGPGAESDAGVAGSRSVAAPPTAAVPAERTGLGFPISDTSDSAVDRTKNWVRLFLSHAGEQTYLRLGAVPNDEARGHVHPIGGASLPEHSGWLDYTEGDRASGTLANAVEVIGGKRRLLVGQPEGAVAEIAEDDFGYTAVINGGVNVTIYDGESIVVETGDQILTALAGKQMVDTGGDFESVQWSYLGTPESGDQVLYAQKDQYLCSGGDQYQETMGDQVYGIHGDQTGTVDGNSTIKYKGNRNSSYRGTSTSTFYGASFDTFMGAAGTFSAGATLDINATLGIVTNAILSQTSLIENYNIMYRADNVKFDTASSIVAAYRRTGVYAFYQEVVEFLNMQVYM